MLFVSLFGGLGEHPSASNARRCHGFPWERIAVLAEVESCPFGASLFPSHQTRYFCSLVVQVIASDIVSLTGENRVLAYFGIKQINTRPSVGLQGLLKMTDLEGKQVNISDLVYRIGPRLNACGRIKSGRAAVELLISNDATVATEIEQTIEAFNSERKEKDEKITQEALQQLEADPEHPNKHTNVAPTDGELLPSDHCSR